MPIYEYRCDECGQEFEKLQKISDDPLSECIYCQGKVRKLVSNSSFHLKGSGWYVTDYAKKSGTTHGTETAKTEKKADSDSSDSKSTASDTKSESK